MRLDQTCKFTEKTGYFLSFGWILQNLARNMSSLIQQQLLKQHLRVEVFHGMMKSNWDLLEMPPQTLLSPMFVASSSILVSVSPLIPQQHALTLMTGAIFSPQGDSEAASSGFPPDTRS